MMRSLTLADVVEGLGMVRPVGLEMPVRAVLDSRKAEPGTFFLAFKGEKADGHDYVAQALANGALAAIVERPVEAPGAQVLDLTAGAALPMELHPPLVIRVPQVLEALQGLASFWRQQFTPRVVGITGSVGKTTTKELVARVLAQRFNVLRSQGSFNNEIGLPLTLLALTSEHQYVVLEMGMYVRGDIRHLAQIARPHIGVVTMVEAVHAERAGRLGDIALGKQELVESLPPAPEGVAILNCDDPRVCIMAGATQARVFYYGLADVADLWADKVESLGLEGIRMRLHYGKETLYLRVPLLGQHSVHTVLRATAVGLVEGLTWQEIVEGLRAPGPQLRLVTVQGRNGSLVIDDTYNASPPSTLAALNLLKDLDGRKIAVLGDMLELGDYEEEGHRKVGVRAAGVVQVLVTVGERARWIAEEARLAGLPADAVHSFATSAEAIAWLQDQVQPKDVILVKGSHAMHLDEVVAALTEES